MIKLSAIVRLGILLAFFSIAAFISTASAANPYGSTCSKNSSAPDFNSNGICETILHSSSTTTPKTSSNGLTTRVYTSGNYSCPSASTGCTLTFSQTVGSSKSGTLNASISGNAGETAKIGATVGFSSSSTYSWSTTTSNSVGALAGRSYYYKVDATGTSYNGRYRSEFWEMNNGWKSVGYKTYGSWTARRYTSNNQGWVAR